MGRRTGSTPAHMRMTTAAGVVHSCGGCFVHHHWMLTSAHCTAMRVSLLIRGGMVSLSETPEYMSETTEFWNYPTYDNSNPLIAQPNDISIVKLQEPIVYTRNLRPIRIQPSADANRNYGYLNMETSGFGATWTEGPLSTVLQWVYLRGVTNSGCRLRFVAELITDAAICARFFNVTSQSPCEGDSGGPLVFTERDGGRTLIGVFSFTAGGWRGCHSGWPAVFIRPGHFHDWFTEISGLDFENLDENEDETTTAPPTTLAPTTLPPTTLPPTTVAPTTLPPTTLPPTTVAPTTLPPTTLSPTTVPTTILPPTTPEGDKTDEGSSEIEDDTPEEDEDLPERLKRLQVKVKVNVNVNESRKKVRIVKKIQ